MMVKDVCPVCGETLVALFSKSGYVIGQCNRCKLMAVMEEIAPSSLEQIYTDDYYERDPARYRSVSSRHRSIWLRRLNQIEEASGSATPGKRLLDMGCGTGAFLAVAQERGWEVTGIEISAAAAREARRVVGANSIFDDISAIGEIPNYHAITMWALIEHLADPMRYLRWAHRILKPEGILALATVSTNAWNRRLFRAEWRYFTPPEHLIYFNEQNLRQALTGVGFEVLSVKSRFSELAFWQSVKVPLFQASTLPARIARKALVTPIKLAAELFGSGDILEIVAKRA